MRFAFASGTSRAGGSRSIFGLLESGCRFEKRKFDDFEDLLKCLAFDATAARRVFDLQRPALST